jgi:hypothetical protein
MFLARCSDVNAIVVPGPYSTRTFYYGRAGLLVGFESASPGDTHCFAYDGKFSAPASPCVPLDPACGDAATSPPIGTITDPDAGAFISWDGGVPSCAIGQAAYDAYLAAQLAQYNTCASDGFCTAGLVSGPANACAQRCDLVLSIAAINSQIIARLDAFGSVACAACDPPPACPPISPFGKCVNGTCVAGP